MIIKGFQKTSLLDYPSKICSLIFTGGCNFKCPFCHNKDLIEINKESLFDKEYVLDTIKKRSHLIDGVCITGGEPLLQKDLKDFILSIKKMNLLIKLDTNGYLPDKLKELITEHLIDYIAMDIKNTKEKYNLTAGVNIDISKIEKSIELIKTSNINYEFRTTVVKNFHKEQDIINIIKWLDNPKKYCLQHFKNGETVLDQNLESYSPKEFLSIAENAKKYIDNLEVRGF